MVPPAYLGKGFATGHQHYLVSGSDTIDSGDLETAVRQVTEHGYGTEPNSRLLALMNPAQAEVVSQWKAGEQNATGIIAKHDYIPSAGAPAYLQPENIVGQVRRSPTTASKFKGATEVFVIQSDFIPEDYFAVVATYGANSPNNAIGFREHPQRQYQGIAQHRRACPRLPHPRRLLSAQLWCWCAPTRPGLRNANQGHG